MALTFTYLHPHGDQLVGWIPEFLSLTSELSAREQININYRHGGGWQPLEGWRYNPTTKVLSYPGDPPLKPIAQATLRDELILVYPHAWVCIVQKNGKYQVARLD